MIDQHKVKQNRNKGVFPVNKLLVDIYLCNVCTIMDELLSVYKQLLFVQMHSMQSTLLQFTSMVKWCGGEVHSAFQTTFTSVQLHHNHNNITI